jgi:hypothetical protein
MTSQMPDEQEPSFPGQSEAEQPPVEEASSPTEEEAQMSVEILRRKHNALKNRDSQIDQGTWEFLGEQWCQLVYQIEDLKDAETLLKEGVIKFRGRASEPKLKKMLEQVQRALYVQSALDFPAGQDWPAWIERPNAYKRALSLADDIQMLLDDQTWPDLGERAIDWQATLLEQALPAYTNRQAQIAHQQARQGEFALALQTIQDALHFLPLRLVKRMKAQVDREGMAALREALVARQECEAALWRGFVRLVGEEASFQEVDADLDSKLIDHPDVAIGDIRTVLADLRKAAGIEAALDTLSAPEGAPVDRSRLERLSQTQFSMLNQIPDFLLKADPRLSHQVQTRFARLLADIDQGPKESLKNLVASFDRPDITHPNQIPDLVERYWQLTWYMDNGQITEPEMVDAAQGALEWTQQRPHIMLLHAAGLFENLSGSVRLQELMVTLDAVRSLIQGLSVNPLGGRGRRGSAYPVALVDASALEEWFQIVSNWMKSYHQWSQNTKSHANVDVQASIQAASTHIETIRGDLHNIKEELWPRLELPAWREDSPISRIEAESNLFVVLAEVFQQIEAERRSRNPIEACIYLDERLEQTGLVENLKSPTLWFWEPLQGRLLKAADSLVKSIQADIHEFLGKLLESSQEPMKSLEQKVFLRPVPEMFVPTIRRSVETHAQRLSQYRNPKLSKAEWSSRWDNVIYAVRTWAGEAGESSQPALTALNLDKLRRDLGEKIDWQGGLDWIMSRRRQVGIALGLTIFLVAFIFGGSALLRRSSLSPDRSSSASSTRDSQPAGNQALLGESPSPSAPATLTPTEDTHFKTATAQAEAASEATQAADRQLAATQTAEQAASTAAQAFTLGQTATAGALETASTSAAAATATAQADPILQATSQALRCLNDPSIHSLQVSEEPSLNPNPGTPYIYGSPAFPVYASWYVTNASPCEWDQLAVAAPPGGEEPRYTFWDEVGQVEVSPEAPLRPGQSLKVVLSFKPLDAQNIDQQWALVANGLTLEGQPHLKLNIQGWIIPVEATLTSIPRPTKEGDSTRPTSAPPTARP